MAGHFLPHVDFLAIGANDLTQYTLAVDRSNRSVMGLVDPLHPAVLQLMSMVCQVGTAAQIPVGLCAGSASDPADIPLLLGLGLTEFRTIPSAIKAVRTSIHHATLETCQQLAAEAMKRSSPQKVRELLSHE